MLLQVEQRSEAWAKARIGRVTASTAAAILCLHPHDGPVTVWKKITGRTLDKSNRHTDWGVEFEQRARGCYEIESGNFVHETGLWVHDEFPWLAASPDGTVRQDGLVEIKCRSKLDESIPLYCRIQALIQLECTSRAWCDYFCWVGDDKTFCKRIYRSPGTCGLIAKLEEFYKTFILADIEPPRRKPKRKRKASAA